MEDFVLIKFMIKVILFDADGVLVNGERFSVVLEREHGISINKTLPFFNGEFQNCLIGNADLKETVEPHLSDWGWEQGTDAFLDYWFNAEHTINEELIEYIQELRQKGIQCFVATNNEKYRFGYMLDKMGFAKSFDKTYSSAHLGSKKPDLEFFQKIYNELENVGKDEILFIDDDHKNVENAKEFGINAEIYQSVDQIKKYFL
ncbi:HAD-IA family hydrolase [Candidatus Nomurabacteria bacterium]|nr:HAD-IA family hydrolase [Candidatus Nomurabacteria bacterium]